MGQIEATKLIALIRGALHSDVPVTNINDADEAHKTIEYATQQGLLMFLNEYDLFREILREKEYFMRTMADVYLRTHQAEELRKLLDAFEENQIFCVILKGVRSRELYPKSEWRSMGDIDLLYLPKQTKQVQRVMRDLGYRNSGDQIKHDEYQKGPVVVEMHKSLCIPDWEEGPYFEAIWDRVVPRDGYRYIFDMTMEDHYLFTFTHLAEHFRSGGIGIRMVLDIYMLSQLNTIDQNYVNQKLCEFGYQVFHQRICELANVWFAADSDGELPKELEELQEYILSGGVFGNWENEKTNMQLQYKGKVHYVAKRLFPRYEVMKTAYSWLRCPMFLPVAWLVRAFQAVVWRSENVKSQMERMQSIQIDEKTVQKRKRFFESMRLHL